VVGGAIVQADGSLLDQSQDLRGRHGLADGRDDDG